MKQFFKSLTFKIGVLIIISEVIVLGVVGVIYINRFSNEVDRRSIERLQLPGKLMRAGLLDYDAVGDEQMMRELVGENLVNGMVVGLNHIIYYSLNSSLLGESLSDIDFVDLGWFNVNSSDDLIIQENEHLISVSRVFYPDGYTPQWFVFMEIETHESVIEKRNISILFIVGSVIALILTSIIILLSFRFSVLNRMKSLLGVLKDVQEGNLAARVGEPISEDEMGVLQKGVNSMTEELQMSQMKIKQALEQIQRNIEQFGFLIDSIRNPLAVIIGHLELGTIESTDTIIIQLDEIEKILKQIDQEWIISETIRDFLKKY